MLNNFIAESNIGLNILMVRDVNTSFELTRLLFRKIIQSILPTRAAFPTRSDITALNKYIQSMKLEQKVMKIGNRPDFWSSGRTHAKCLVCPINGRLWNDDNPYRALVFKMYRSETKSIGFQIQSMELEKQTMELMAKRMLSDKLTMLRLRKRAISELH